MMRGLRFACLSLLVLFATTLAAVSPTETPGFASLLAESGLSLQPQKDLVKIPVQADSAIPYEHALRHSSGLIELRFIVRPLERIEIEYEDPHNAAPEPNHLFPLLFESMTNALADGSDSNSSEFTEAESREFFNADWAAVASFEVNREHAGGYRNALLVAMHKNDLADAYTLFLYNDYSEVKPILDASLAILRFAADNTL